MLLYTVRTATQSIMQLDYYYYGHLRCKGTTCTCSNSSSESLDFSSNFFLILRYFLLLIYKKADKWAMKTAALHEQIVLSASFLYHLAISVS